ncbi:MAG: hypothetical protein AVDCRST_MAG34-743 [uncultured Nocardioidaceae bacterium]|uniref:Two-component transcriptional response regulator, LuxR family n=1 Tax=uncultured Nocardioidaceae bacterium TaxID=253824 RepID=A0A6J4LRG2_9ACTN|nr:MAG: hypothetical protein AVDCRST_MAG34-743 [uncultured Nocardioidaceae bacterium]
MSGLRIVMADDHAHVRAHLRQALEAHDCEICGEGATAQEAVDLALQCEPDVVLLDIHMPGNGISAAERIGAELPQTAVVMLTSSQEDADLFDSLKAGASGYLLKGGDPQELYPALRGVLAGEAAMPPALVSRILEEFRTPTRRGLLKRPSTSATATKLSPRELEVMVLLKEGHTTEEVAGKLFLSPTTVRVHVSTVLRKLRVKDRESAFRLLPDE